MANREQGSVALEVDGTTYHLRVTLNAMCEIEDALFEPARACVKCGESAPAKDTSFSQFMARLPAMRMRDVRLFLWAALLEDQPSLTLEAAGRIVTQMGGPFALFTTINRLTATTDPDPADVEALGLKPDANPRRARPGRTGGRSTSKRVGTG